MAIKKKKTNNKVGKDVMQLWWKTVWTLLKKLKIKLPYDPAITHLGTYQKKANKQTKNLKAKNTNSKRHMHHNDSSIIYNCQDVKAT